MEGRKRFSGWDWCLVRGFALVVGPRLALRIDMLRRGGGKQSPRKTNIPQGRMSSEEQAFYFIYTLTHVGKHSGCCARFYHTAR